MDYDYSTYDSSYYNYSNTSPDAAGFVAIVMGFLLVYFLFIVALYVVSSIFLGKIFNKAGVPAWVAWVPVYNSWKMLQIGGQQGWWSLIMFVPIVNIAAIVFMYIAMFHIGKKLGKEDWFILLAIFLGLVWVIWLGADDSKWNESKGAPRTDTPTLPPAKAPTAAPAA